VNSSGPVAAARDLVQVTEGSAIILNYIQYDNMPKAAIARDDVGTRIRLLRKRSGVSARQLAHKAGVSPAMISYVERGMNSPRLVTLQKVLTALGVSMAEFFTDRDAAGSGPVFTREQMRVVSDPDRTYTMLLGHRPGVSFEMFDEQIRSGKKRPQYAKFTCDIAGYILTGELVLEIKGKEKRILRAGDAFYVTKGTTHRGYAPDGHEARLITVSYPASY
jgi:transcriptional regulator with XRE-family HTH domain